MIWAIIGLVATSIWLYNFIDEKVKKKGFGSMDIWKLFGITICLVINGIGLGMHIAKEVIDSKPTAMDVYQGRTTLEYVVKDGIMVDSVVVFKKEIQNN